MEEVRELTKLHQWRGEGGSEGIASARLVVRNHCCLGGGEKGSPRRGRSQMPRDPSPVTMVSFNVVFTSFFF